MKTIIEAIKEKYGKYPKRMCYSLHSCAICEEDIRDGQTYYDGGYGNRAHDDCVNPELLSPNATSAK